MRVGVFGGTFDPIHVGHLMVAEKARTELGLKEVLFVTAGVPWLKMDKPIAEAKHRLAMVELAVEKEPNFRSTDVEVQRSGPSYTAITLKWLKCMAGEETDLYLIVGIDALNELSRWHRPAEVFELSTVVAVPRPGSPDLDRKELDEVSEGASEKVIVLNGPMVRMSSTSVKEKISRGLPISHHVPKSVEKYIINHHLYRTTSEQREDKHERC